MEIKNKKAGFLYFFLQTYTAGIVLYGTEIKSIREGKCNLTDSYCTFTKGELWVLNLHISQYRFGSYYNHDVKRERKLLLNKAELRKLEAKTKEKGLTIVPVRLYIDERGYAKLEIALCKGKHLFDKRQTIKENDSRRDVQRELKSKNIRY
jgi:SsrA-binding protein